MITCPYCNHKEIEETVGEDGEPKYKFNRAFYKLPVELKDSEKYFPNTAELYGCPECKKVFIS